MAYYAVFNYNVEDPDGYKAYQQAAGPSFAGHAFKVLALDPATRLVEGDGAARQTVIIEFETKEAFDAWYDSPDYQAAAAKRWAATSGGVGLGVQGLPARP